MSKKINLWKPTAAEKLLFKSYLKNSGKRRGTQETHVLATQISTKAMDSIRKSPESWDYYPVKIKFYAFKRNLVSGFLKSFINNHLFIIKDIVKSKYLVIEGIASSKRDEERAIRMTRTEIRKRYGIKLPK